MTKNPSIKILLQKILTCSTINSFRSEVIEAQRHGQQAWMKRLLKLTGLLFQKDSIEIGRFAKKCSSVLKVKLALKVHH